ncbi:MAG: lipoyl(octanoyl) transferase LipB [Dehalococcoidia bacterium]|nr:lipoyl(octanoyl) transferase LipB [Dehalococcoidia bacterium]
MWAFRRPGLTEYGEACRIQRMLWASTLAGQGEDSLLMLEHPPTITLGKSGKIENLLISKEALADRGLSLFFTERGGDITYHGPGQLVVYPIIDLRNRGKDIHRYVHDLEEVVIRTLADLEIRAGRDERNAGVWAGGSKIAAIGVSVRRWVTMHGLALNVNPDLSHFSLINPCGFADMGVTSVSQVLGQGVPLELAAARLLERFAEVFEVNIEELPGEFAGRLS